MVEKPTLDRRTVLKALGAGTLFSGMGVASAAPGRQPGPKKDEILVGVSTSTSDMEATVKRAVPGNARIVHRNETLSYVAVQFPSQAPDHAKENFVDAMTKKDEVKYAESNATHQSLATPNDPRFADQYAPQQVNAPAAWDTTLGDANVTVAVIDTGVQYDHPDLAGNFGSEKGKDFADNDGDPYPDVPADEYHGTHVAGIVASNTDNGTGVAGMGNSTLLSGRALDEGGSGSTADIADAIEWAADQGADVINMSLGGGGYTNTMKNAVSYAQSNGSLVVAAAGNNGTGSVSYPAAYNECLAVSALDSNENLASYSQYGNEIELAAPGSDVLSTTTETRGSYEKLSGTSMATPAVSGVAGLTLAQWNLTNSELRSHLKNTAVDVGLPADEQGSGRVDAANAVSTDPGSGDGGGGGGGGGDGGTSTSTSVDGSLSSSYDSKCWSYGFEYGSPSQVVVEIDGPANADFDLYANDGTGSCPTTGSYDYRSWTPDSQETITIDSPDTSSALYVLVDSYSGGGSYTLTITETA
ncbi:S8 family serine peptidase [Halococcus sediminicola]|uniref:S8 family serine peptidase n=1 Tax=Halococcus sediminicola TaxID=1264579 RepID=UPI0006785083|nr:S8 family serine peptidase [Halococcus sediminicola]